MVSTPLTPKQPVQPFAGKNTLASTECTGGPCYSASAVGACRETRQRASTQSAVWAQEEVLSLRPPFCTDHWKSSI